MKRWMALDVGSKTIGVAITDPLKVTVRPLKTLIRESLDRDAERISELIDEQEIERLVVEAVDIAYRPTTSVPEPAAMSAAMGDAFFEILTFIDTNGLQEDGAPMSITRSFSGAQLLFDSAIPVRGVTDATPTAGQTVRIRKSYAGEVIRVPHLGSYRTLSATHR